MFQTFFQIFAMERNNDLNAGFGVIQFYMRTVLVNDDKVIFL